ncbi:serine/threonine protein kinase [Frankia sp. AgB32]|uniref:serine/threonine protein kinase n=1 Tax=Frankia sp. AgB32 TaxID=631119 RepID=UPI0020101851|nr:serine/threonine protein kinase [Frankia sp. AgB32]MCK9897453.1 serine/threonine protein kinase [Frankia sp. AgB32]
MTFSDGSADRPVGRAGGEPEVPGVSLRSRPRDAGSGELWAGQFDQSGVECVVRRVRLAPDPVLRSAAMSAARALAELEHPHLVPVLTALPTADGLAVITRPVVGAISLARLLVARGALDPGEVVTVGLPIAQALAVAHEAGVVHGRLEPEDILLEPTGRPVLAGVGVAALADAARPDPMPPGAAAADVRDLATLLLGAMREATGPEAAAVAVAVATALVDDPHRRPGAGDLAATLARSATPLPVRLVTPGQPDPAGPAGPAERPADPPLPSAPPRRTADRRPRPGDRTGPAADDGGREPGGAGEAGEDARPRLLAGARLGLGPEDDNDDADGDAHGGAGGRPGEGRPGRGATGATAVDAAELLGSLPPPPKRSTPGRRAGRAATRPDPVEVGAGDRPPGRSVAGPGRARPGSTAGSPSSAAAAGTGASTAGRSGTGGSGGRAGRAAGTRRPQRAGARRYRWLLPVTAGIGLFAVVVAAVLLMTSPSGHDADDAASTSPGSATSAPGAASHDPTASPVANQSPEQIWRGVLGALNTARSRAFEHAQESLLAESDAPGSPAYNADVSLMRQVVALGAHSSPLRTVIDALEVRSDTADRTVVRVTDHLDAYDYLDASGQVVGHKDAKSPQRRDLVLVRTTSGWRVSDTVPITAG